MQQPRPDWDALSHAVSWRPVIDGGHHGRSLRQRLNRQSTTWRCSQLFGDGRKSRSPAA
jgi:hypothetical protein